MKIEYYLLIVIIFITSSCDENIESIDATLLIGEWVGTETWDDYTDNILLSSKTGDFYINFLQNGTAMVFSENFSQDTVLSDWFYSEGNHKLFILQEYTVQYPSDTVIRTINSGDYYNILSIDNDQLNIEKIKQFIYRDETYRDEFNWSLQKVN